MLAICKCTMYNVHRWLCSFTCAATLKFLYFVLLSNPRYYRKLLHFQSHWNSERFYSALILNLRQTQHILYRNNFIRIKFCPIFGEYERQHANKPKIIFDLFVHTIVELVLLAVRSTFCLKFRNIVTYSSKTLKQAKYLENREKREVKISLKNYIQMLDLKLNRFAVVVFSINNEF